MSIDVVKQHLEHFCAKLPQVPYSDKPRPEYVLIAGRNNQFGADVILPQSVDIRPRRISGIHWWQSPKMAKKDAAFRAYERLYLNGLLNEHLLPVELPDPMLPGLDIEQQIEEGPVLRMNPWSDTNVLPISSSPYTISIQHSVPSEAPYPKLHIFLPWTADLSMSFDLFWSPGQTMRVDISRAEGTDSVDFHKDELQRLGTLSTMSLFESIFLSKLGGIDGQIWSPPFLAMPFIDPVRLLAWLTPCSAKEPGGGGEHVDLDSGLIRLRCWPKTVRPYIGHSRTYCARKEKRCTSEENMPTAVAEELHWEVKRLPKKLDYLKSSSASVDFHTATVLIPAADCRVDPFPTPYARLMLLIPSILHCLEIRQVAICLQNNLLAPVMLCNTELIEEAICASSANEQKNYQRLELIGDSVLKFWTSAWLTAEYPGWHEGYLSRAKEKVVSNSHLIVAAKRIELAQYIHTEAFSSSRWRPPTLDFSHEDHTKRTDSVPRKVLADVVEALIGAAFLDGKDYHEGTKKVHAALTTLLKDVSWRRPSDNAVMLRDLVPDEVTQTGGLHHLVDFTGYRFNKEILLQAACTHPSHLLSDLHSSYQRLEFLGDAILDFIVVHEMSIWAPRKNLSHVSMHLIRAAVVNADLLAYFCLDSAVRQERTQVVKTRPGEFDVKTEEGERYLWQHMRHSGDRELVEAQKACFERFKKSGPAIAAALLHGTHHPWCLLLSLGAPKFFSDMIESLLGAIFIDSGGDLSPCQAFLERLGLIEYLRRIINDTEHIDLMHPTERLGIVVGNCTTWTETRAERKQKRKRGNESDVSYSATVFVADEPWISSIGHVGREAAKAKAAEETISTWSTRAPRFPSGDMDAVENHEKP